jgi:hypothetical protein
MDTNANRPPGATIKAADEAKTGCLREENNAEWRPRRPVPSGLLPVQRVRVHSVNRP